MKTRKPLVSTDYAYQNKKTKLWYALGDASNVPESYRGKSFAEALKTPARADINEKRVLVVAVRCRALSTKTKRSPKRTR
jgi:hypothetical protein